MHLWFEIEPGTLGKAFELALAIRNPLIMLNKLKSIERCGSIDENDLDLQALPCAPHARPGLNHCGTGSIEAHQRIWLGRASAQWPVPHSV